VRNIFDQYSQPENRVTHALLVALDQDRALLASFLRDLLKIEPPAGRLSVNGQKAPGAFELDRAEKERRGIPDGWIADEDGWCVVIECKVLAGLRREQLERHHHTAQRRGFQRITVLAITPRIESNPPAGTVVCEWRDVYVWLCQKSGESEWAKRAVSFLEISEARLVESGQLREGTLTQFSGFNFGSENPFTYLEGKRVLGLALSELRKRQDLQRRLRMNAQGSGRPAITGREENRVWDFLPLSTAPAVAPFNKHIHLTMGIHADAVVAMVTVPHAVNTETRQGLVRLGEAGFLELIRSINENLQSVLQREPHATPRLRGMQRRYPSQRAIPIVDASIDFDLRAAVPTANRFKVQPNWLTAAYGSFVDKRQSNYQIQVGVVFPFEKCQGLRKPEALDLIADAWLGCKPLVDLAK
jgi:hypothetical protein